MANTQLFKHAYGAFLGVLCGDAAGATLEFSVGEITMYFAEKAMKMPGGGVMRVGKGQITDDSELALSLATGLVGKDPRDGFPFQSVAMQYSKWCLSGPFDIGNTCKTAFDGPSDSESMLQRATQYNMDRCSNGSLMRILPLALWCVNESTDTIARLASQEALLSHPNQVCQDCNAIYCLLVTYLIKNPGQSDAALNYAENYVVNNVTSVVREWYLVDSKNTIDSIDCTKLIGFVRWGFTLAIYFLRRKESYENAIKITLTKGGDTDTNAAIVGGLLGALYGSDAIPDYMAQPVMAFDPTSPLEKRQRPKEYRASRISLLTAQLVGN